MRLDVDLVQRFKVMGLFSLQVYKVVTGTMLTLFIPQGCEDVHTDTKRVCSLEENYHNPETFHKLALALNGLSMLLFLITYLLEMRRESWAIRYLDIDSSLPDNSLKEIIRTEPVLDARMDQINKRYWHSLLTTTSFYALNVGVSVKILWDNYHSSSTVTCFLSFTLLVLIKLYNSVVVAYQSVTHDKMMSAYLTEHSSFNALDSDYIRQKNISPGNQP